MTDTEELDSLLDIRWANCQRTLHITHGGVGVRLEPAERPEGPGPMDDIESRPGRQVAIDTVTTS